jgi:hypothetical protein
MVSRVLRVWCDVDHSVMLSVISGCVKVQGLMEPEGSETEEETGNDGNDGNVGPMWTRTETDVGGQGSEIG